MKEEDEKTLAVCTIPKHHHDYMRAMNEKYNTTYRAQTQAAIQAAYKKDIRRGRYNPEL